MVWAAATVWYRSIQRRPDRPSPELRRRDALRPLEPGESYDTAVKLTLAPNVPMAELVCSQLRANGIEAFVKRAPVFDALVRSTSDFGPAEVWVGTHELQRAQALFES